MSIPWDAPPHARLTPEEYYRGMGVHYQGPAPTDAQRLAQHMGQFQNWYDKLFEYRSYHLGWCYIKGVTNAKP